MLKIKEAHYDNAIYDMINDKNVGHGLVLFDDDAVYCIKGIEENACEMICERLMVRGNADLREFCELECVC